MIHDITDEEIKTPEVLAENNVFQNSFWMDCLFEVAEAKRAAGEKTVPFREVDLLVVQKSKLIIKYETGDPDE